MLISEHLGSETLGCPFLLHFIRMSPVLAGLLRNLADGVEKKIFFLDHRMCVGKCSTWSGHCFDSAREFSPKDTLPHSALELPFITSFCGILTKNQPFLPKAPFYAMGECRLWSQPGLYSDVLFPYLLVMR